MSLHNRASRENREAKLNIRSKREKKVGEEKNVDREIRFCRSIDFIKRSLSVSHPQKLASFFSQLASKKKIFLSAAFDETRNSHYIR